MGALLRYQKNDVYRWIEETGLEPKHFHWLPETGDDVDQSKLIHQPTGHWFLADLHRNGDADLRYVPSPAGTVVGGNLVNVFDDTKEMFHIWLGWVEKESEPDLWAEMPFREEMFQGAGPDDNELLTQTETVKVRERLEVARKVLIEADLVPEALEAANAKLDSIMEATERLGRFDWRHFAMGLMMEIAAMVSLTNPQAQEFIGAMFSEAVKLIGG